MSAPTQKDAVPGLLGNHLGRLLGDRAARAGLPAPRIVYLGDVDAMGAGAGADRRQATVHVTAQAVLVGPWGGPSTGAACGHCLDIRWQRLRSVHRREALEAGPGFRGTGRWPVPTAYLVDAVWAAYLAAFGPAVSSGPRPGVGEGLAQVTAVDVTSMISTTVPVLPESHCPSCSFTHSPDRADRPGGRTTADPRLGPQPKPGPGGYRLRTPAEYALPYQALANPVCGALGGEVVSGLTSTTTSPVMGMWRQRGRTGLHEMSWSGQANGFGRSRDLAFLEGLERHAGSLPRRDAQPVMGSYNELRSEALDPRDCGVYSATSYAESSRLTPFDPDRAIPWVWGYSLRDKRPVLVPQRITYYSSGTPGDQFVDECSNGCASGATLEEAILFGLLELIERDAFLLGWYGAAELTEIDLTAGASPVARAMLDRSRFLGYRVKVFDNRIDLPIPAVTVVAERLDGGPGLLSFAAGASLDPDTAIEGALSEICTYIPIQPRSYRQRKTELEAMVDDFSRVEQLRDHAGLSAVPRMRRHALRYLESARSAPKEQVYAGWQEQRPVSMDLLDDVYYLRDQLAALGYDVIVVDQTSPEQMRFGLHNVMMIVPGLIPIDFGWDRQRALEMPRMLTAQRRGGLRESDLTPTDLHRVPHPFP